MGIVGLGRIGMAIAKRAEAFGMSIAYTSRNARPESPYPYFAERRGARRARSTSSSSSRPAAPATRKLIDAKVLAALGKKGYLVNVARGSVVDEQALVERAARRHDRRRRPRRVRERAERAERAARARQRRPHAARRQRDLADAPGDGRPGVRQPRGALRGQAAALAGAMSGARRLRSLGPSWRSSPAPARASAWRSRAASPRPGARVVLNGRTRAKLDAAATLLRGEGLAVEVAAFDVADPDAVRSGVAAVAGARSARSTSSSTTPASSTARRSSTSATPTGAA